jgi:hypothetical protein
MLPQIRSQLVPAEASEWAFTEVCLQPRLCPKQVDPNPSSETVRRCYDLQDPIGIAASQARPAVSASGKVHSIPIHPPR